MKILLEKDIKPRCQKDSSSDPDWPHLTFSQGHFDETVFLECDCSHECHRRVYKCRSLLSFVSHYTVLTVLQVLHLLAMARAADLDLKIDDFQDIANKTPFLADLK